MPPETSPKQTIVFIHGLWLHAESWNAWMQFFQAHGYSAQAASWPGDAETTQATRQNPSALAGYGITEIADHIARQVVMMQEKPILVGHSFGGLLVQNLLGRNLASAAIAIDPAPIKGVYELPPPGLKSIFSVLSNPFNFNRAVALSENQFRYAFTNALSEQEAHDLYATYAMPAPARPVFQAATALFNPNPATKVNVTNPSRGPLLLISGALDHAVPTVWVRSALRVYRRSPTVTEFKEFAGRGHSLVIDSGWRELAEYCLDWLRSKGL